MRKLILPLLMCLGLAAKAQKVETFEHDGLKLTFQSNDANFDKQLKMRMIDAFFAVYPKLAEEYNPSTIKTVAFVIDTAYKGVAATSNGSVVYSAAYMRKNPGDIDVVTHEVMHIVQNYGNSVGPWWLTEGIADYARYKFGIDNAAAKWSLPDLKPTHKVDNGYRITARFLNWIETTVKPGTVTELDRQLRNHTFTDESWKTLTGKDLVTLWAEYSK